MSDARMKSAAPPRFALYERRGAVGLVTLNRPERLNAMSGDLMDDMAAALTVAFADPDTGAVVLTGAGRAFCAGDDLKEYDAQSADEASIRLHVDRIQAITSLSKMVTKNIRSASVRWAIEMIDSRGLFSFV